MTYSHAPRVVGVVAAPLHQWVGVALVFLFVLDHRTGYGRAEHDGAAAWREAAGEWGLTGDQFSHLVTILRGSHLDASD